MVEIHRAYICDPRVHGKNLLRTGIKGAIRAVAEIKGLFEKDKLGLWPEFLMTLP